MAAWTQHVRHPWFNPTTTKRKLFTGDDDDDHVSSAMFSPSRRKRVRYDSLERTLAHMTIGNMFSEDVDMWPKISAPRSCKQETQSVILPSSVEEPAGTLPASEPVDMEVEPTSVTTDNSDAQIPHDWGSTGSGQLDIREVEISPVVLDCLRRQSERLPALIPLPPQTCQALVLYRSPRPLSPNGVEDQTRTPITVAHEDVMEVE